MREVDAIASERTTVRRLPERAHYDSAGIHAILDEGLLAHVGMVTPHGPVVIPMLYARDGEMLYLHGSAASRLLREGRGVELCVTVSIVDGLVVARAIIHRVMG